MVGIDRWVLARKSLAILLLFCAGQCTSHPQRSSASASAPTFEGPSTTEFPGWFVTYEEISQTQRILSGMARASECGTVFFDKLRPLYVESNGELARIWLRSTCCMPKLAAPVSDLKALEIGLSGEGSVRLLSNEELTRNVIPEGLQPVSRGVFFAIQAFAELESQNRPVEFVRFEGSLPSKSIRIKRPRGGDPDWYAGLHVSALNGSYSLVERCLVAP